MLVGIQGTHRPLTTVFNEFTVAAGIGISRQAVNHYLTCGPQLTHLLVKCRIIRIWHADRTANNRRLGQ